MTLNTKTFMQVQTENAAKQREAERTLGAPVVVSPCGIPIPEPVPEPVKQSVKQSSVEKNNG